jgi:hypothetical protein
MRVSVDGNEIELPGATSLAELMEALAPLIDPARVVTRIEVDGTPADPTDRLALAARRLSGRESVAVGSETPRDFAASRRREISGHLHRLADRLTEVASGLAAGETVVANRLLASATRDLALVLELDHQVAVLEAGVPGCGAVVAAVDRVGPRLAAAERGRRWGEVAELLSRELVPVLRAGTPSS